MQCRCHSLQFFASPLPFIAILRLAFAFRCLTMPLPCLASPCSSFAYHCTSMPCFAFALQTIALPCVSFPRSALPSRFVYLRCLTMLRFAYAFRFSTMPCPCRAMPRSALPSQCITAPCLCYALHRHSMPSPYPALLLLCINKKDGARFELRLLYFISAHLSVQDLIGKPAFSTVSPLPEASQGTIIQHFDYHLFMAVEEQLNGKLHGSARGDTFT